MPYTSSPGPNRVTCVPTASTTPHRSSPRVNGGSPNLRTIPDRTFQSAGVHPGGADSYQHFAWTRYRPVNLNDLQDFRAAVGTLTDRAHTWRRHVGVPFGYLRWVGPSASRSC